MKTLARSLSGVVLSTVVFVSANAVSGAQMASMPGMSGQGQAKAMPSPPAVAETMLGGTKVTIHYNTPSMRGRKIMGELVPFGKVWRTGANPATSFVTSGPLKVGHLDLPAGTYTLYTLPGAPGTPWLLILNKQTGQWGTEYHADQDFGRTPMTAATLPSSQEVMSLSFEDVHGKHAQLHVRWETTDEWVPVEAQ